MKKFSYWISICFIIIAAAGCRSMQSSQNKQMLEQEKAMISVGEAMTGKELSQEQIKDLEHKVVTDPETRSAVETISSSLSGAQPKANYCPIDGKRYAPNITICPEHGEKLIPLE